MIFHSRLSLIVNPKKLKFVTLSILVFSIFNDNGSTVLFTRKQNSVHVITHVVRLGTASTVRLIEKLNTDDVICKIVSKARF